MNKDSVKDYINLLESDRKKTITQLINVIEQNIPNVPAGDLHVQIRIRNHHRFQRYGDNILCEVKVDAWDLMLGSKAQVATIDNRSIEINNKFMPILKMQPKLIKVLILNLYFIQTQI